MIRMVDFGKNHQIEPGDRERPLTLFRNTTTPIWRKE
jgi:hypothetical protein